MTEDSAGRASGPEARLEAVWREAVSDRRSLAGYFCSRGLPADFLDRIADGTLRLHPSLAYWDYDPEGRPELIGRFPAMIARATDRDGLDVTLHRTYLDANANSKLCLEENRPAKKLMTPRLGASIRGCSVKLLRAGSVLGLTEGIETAAAVIQATGQACWSCLSAAGLRTVEIPAPVCSVHIWADNDASAVGQSAALAAAGRLLTEGREVFLHIPPAAGEDWLDVYCTRGENPFSQNWPMLTPGSQMPPRIIRPSGIHPFP